jgi:hypothetical protein
MKCEELNGRYFNHNIGVSVKFLGFSVAASAGDVWVSFPSFQYPLLWGEREREKKKSAVRLRHTLGFTAL